MERLAEAERVVIRYTQRHVRLDVGLGIVGSLPIPWFGTASVAAAIAAQAPAIYQPMVRELCSVYNVNATKRMGALSKRSALAGGIVDLAGEFGKEFVVHHLKDSAIEYGIGVAATSAPIIGGIIGAIVDVKVAKEVTRLVGVMTLVYLENDADWVGTKQTTYQLVKMVLKEERKTPVAELVRKIVLALRADAVTIDALRTLREQYGENASVIIDSIIAGAPFAEDANNVSQPVLEAITHLRHNLPDFDEHRLADLFQALRQYKDNNWTDQFAGHVGEMMAHDNMPGSTLPDIANQEAIDLTDKFGQHWQVKVGDTAAQMARDHLAAHPDVPIITDEPSADVLQADHLHAVGMASLDHDHILKAVDSTTISISDLIHEHPSLPLFATVIALYQEASRWKAGEISASRMIFNISARVGSRSASIFFVTSSLVLVATSAGILAGAGPLLAGGAMIGGMAGNEVAGALTGDALRNYILQLRLPVRFANQLVIMSRAGATT